MRPYLRFCLILLVTIHAATVLASYVAVPVPRLVEESDLIVIGRVIQETPDRYKSHLAGNRPCGKSEAVVTVIEVLRGHLEASRATKLPDGNYVQTIRVRHFRALTPGEGNFTNTMVSGKYKGRLDGIWFLQRSNADGVYCILQQWPTRLDELNDVRACIRGTFAEHSTPEYKTNKKH